MDIHENAHLTSRGREHMVTMVLGGQTPKAVSEAVGVCPRTVRKWVDWLQSRSYKTGFDDVSNVPQCFDIVQPFSE
jgi:transposase-like protein